MMKHGRDAWPHGAQMLSRLKIRSGMARIMLMIPHQNMGKYTSSRPFLAWARQARAHRVIEETRRWDQPSDHVPLITEFDL